MLTFVGILGREVQVVVLTINFYSRMGSNVGWLRDSNDCTRYENNTTMELSCD